MDDVQTAPEVQSNNLTTEQGAEKIKALMFPQEQPQQPSPAPEEVVEDEGEAIEDVEPAETEQSDTDEPDQELFEVTVEGQKRQVTLEELRKGYQLEAHYTQKSQKLAEAQKAVEAERAVLSGVHQKFEQMNDLVTYLQHANQYIESTLPPMPDANLLESNPAAYIKAKEARDAAMKNLSTLNQGIETTRQQAKAIVAELQRAGAVVLQEKMPELLQADASQKLYGYLQDSYGYSAEQINQNVDPHLFILAEKARRYDELQAKSVDPTHVAQKVTKAKAKPKPYQNKAATNHQAAKSEFQKKPNFANAAALIKVNGYAS